MKIVIISDTHGHEATLGRFSADVLIHCGDVQGGFGRRDADLDALDSWLGQQDVRHALLVGGNHDRALERRADTGIPPLRNARYLQDEGVTIDGVRFYGAPWVPHLPGHAYHLSQADIAARWAQIPADTDVLITHTPPAGIMDRTSLGLSVGCAALQATVARIRPRLHCFGHVHASYGWEQHGPTWFANAALLQRRGPLRDALIHTL